MLKSYGINKSTETKDEVAYHLEEMRHLGFSIVENVIDKSELSVLKNELQRIYEKQERAFGGANLKAINEDYMARALLCYSEPYLNLARNGKVMEYVKAVLGNYFVLHLQNGIINMPGQEHHQSSWHRDFPYQNWVSSEPIGCNVFYCLDDFNAETGGTFVLPFSHKIDHAPSEQYMAKNAVQVNAKAGSAILFDSMLFHKAGFNKSRDIIRRGVNNLYTKAIVRQQINLPEMLKGKYAEDPFLNMLLGYDAQTPLNVEDFRNRRLRKNQKQY